MGTESFGRYVLGFTDESPLSRPVSFEGEGLLFLSILVRMSQALYAYSVPCGKPFKALHLLSTSISNRSDSPRSRSSAQTVVYCTDTFVLRGGKESAYSISTG